MGGTGRLERQILEAGGWTHITISDWGKRRGPRAIIFNSRFASPWGAIRL